MPVSGRPVRLGAFASSQARTSARYILIRQLRVLQQHDVAGSELMGSDCIRLRLRVVGNLAAGAGGFNRAR